MTDPHDSETARTNEELIELLVRRATEALSPQETERLRQLASGSPAGEVEGWDRAAAAVYLVAAPEAEEMPPSIRARLERDAARRIRMSSRHRRL
jgi:hypothetical protein